MVAVIIMIGALSLGLWVERNGRRGLAVVCLGVFAVLGFECRIAALIDEHYLETYCKDGKREACRELDRRNWRDMSLEDSYRGR